MTTVLLAAIGLVAVMFLVVVGALALAARAYSRRQLGDARAQARHWVERLGAELLVLDAAAVRRRTVDPAGLGEAAERFAAANAELAAAGSRRQCRIAQDTAVEGLHHVRTARRSLGLDPGPRVPGQGVVDTIRTALADGSWSMPRLAEAVLADAGERARPLPAGSVMAPPATSATPVRRKASMADAPAQPGRREAPPSDEGRGEPVARGRANADRPARSSRRGVGAVRGPAACHPELVEELGIGLSPV